MRRLSDRLVSDRLGAGTIDRGIGAAHRLDDADPEPVPRAGLAQHLGRAAPPVAERAVVPNHQMGHPDRADQHLLDKRFG